MAKATTASMSELRSRSNTTGRTSLSVLGELPQSPLREVAEPVPVLHGEGLVEAELLAQVGLGLLGGVAAEDHGGHVAGQHRRRPEDDDRGEDHGEHHEAEAPEDEAAASGAPLFGCEHRASRPAARQVRPAGYGSRSRWSPSPSRHGGSCCTQMSPRKRGQRGWKRQPDGTSMALGTLPLRRIGFCFTSGSASGTAESRASV